MPGTRKSYAPSLTAKVAMEAIKAQRTAAEIATIYRVHRNLIGIWKKQAVENLPEIFNSAAMVGQQNSVPTRMSCTARSECSR